MTSPIGAPLVSISASKVSPPLRAGVAFDAFIAYAFGHGANKTIREGMA